MAFLYSLVAMHIHLWRLRRRHRLMLEQGLIPPGSHALHMMLKLTVNLDVLETFPVRVIGAPNSAAAASPAVEEPGSTSAPKSVESESTTTLYRSQSTKSVRSVKAVENAEAVAKGLRRTQSSKSLRRSEVVEGAAAQEVGNEEMCVICLDEYEQGDRVRKLVCGHEYHCECIGTFLSFFFFFFNIGEEYVFPSLWSDLLQKARLGIRSFRPLLMTTPI